jgi:hypothetical protein
MKLVLGIVLFALGGVLLYFGINATDAPMEQFGKELTGKYSDNTQAYLIGGAVAAVAGLAMILFGRK